MTQEIAEILNAIESEIAQYSWQMTNPDQNNEYGVWEGRTRCISEGLSRNEAMAIAGVSKLAAEVRRLDAEMEIAKKQISSFVIQLAAETLDLLGLKSTLAAEREMSKRLAELLKQSQVIGNIRDGEWTNKYQAEWVGLQDEINSTLAEFNQHVSDKKEKQE